MLSQLIAGGERGAGAEHQQGGHRRGGSFMSALSTMTGPSLEERQKDLEKRKALRESLAAQVAEKKERKARQEMARKAEEMLELERERELSARPGSGGAVDGSASVLQGLGEFDALKKASESGNTSSGVSPKRHARPPPTITAPGSAFGIGASASSSSGSSSSSSSSPLTSGRNVGFMRSLASMEGGTVNAEAERLKKEALRNNLAVQIAEKELKKKRGKCSSERTALEAERSLLDKGLDIWGREISDEHLVPRRRHFQRREAELAKMEAEATVLEEKLRQQRAELPVYSMENLGLPSPVRGGGRSGEAFVPSLAQPSQDSPIEKLAAGVARAVGVPMSVGSVEAVGIGHGSEPTTSSSSSSSSSTSQETAAQVEQLTLLCQQLLQEQKELRAELQSRNGAEKGRELERKQRENEDDKHDQNKQKESNRPRKRGAAPTGWKGSRAPTGRGGVLSRSAKEAELLQEQQRRVSARGSRSRRKAGGKSGATLSAAERRVMARKQAAVKSRRRARRRSGAGTEVMKEQQGIAQSRRQQDWEHEEERPLPSVANSEMAGHSEFVFPNSNARPSVEKENRGISEEEDALGRMVSARGLGTESGSGSSRNRARSKGGQASRVPRTRNPFARISKR